MGAVLRVAGVPGEWIMTRLRFFAGACARATLHSVNATVLRSGCACSLFAARSHRRVMVLPVQRPIGRRPTQALGGRCTGQVVVGDDQAGCPIICAVLWGEYVFGCQAHTPRVVMGMLSGATRDNAGCPATSTMSGARRGI